MRVLLVTQYFPPEIGATQNRLVDFARSLVAAGHVTDVLTEMPNHPAGVVFPGYRGRWFVREALEGFTVFRVGVLTSPKKTFVTRLAFYGSFWAAALASAPRLAPAYDAVVATSPPLPVADAGRWLARWKRAAFVMDVRDLWPKAAAALGELSNPRVYRLAERLERSLYDEARRILVTTRSFAGYIEALGVAADRLAHVPNGTRPDVFSPDRGTGDAVARYGLEGRFVVTYAGLHGIAQGLETVLDAAERLAAVPDVTFLLVGDGPAKAALIERARARGLENVRFEPAVPLERCAEILNASDVLLVPLSAQPLFDWFVPSKLFDSMASARPVLLSVGGEAREILERAGGGCHVAPGDPRALADAVLAVRAWPAERREAVGRAGRAYVLAHYSRPVIGEQFVRIVEQAARERAAAAEAR